MYKLTFKSSQSTGNHQVFLFIRIEEITGRILTSHVIAFTGWINVEWNTVIKSISRAVYSVWNLHLKLVKTGDRHEIAIKNGFFGTKRSR